MRAKAPARSEQTKAPRSVAANLDVSDNYTVIDVQKNSSQRIRISHTFYRGKEYVDVRLWAVDEQGNYRPTRQGVSIRPELLADVIQGLMTAGRTITQGVRHG